RDVVRIAAEFRDIVADPLQCRDLIEQALVAARRDSPVGDVVQTQKAQRSKAIVDRDDDHVAAPGENRAVIDFLRACANRESTAMKPDHYRSPRAIQSRRPQIEIKAVLRMRLI